MTVLPYETQDELDALLAMLNDKFGNENRCFSEHSVGKNLIKVSRTSYSQTSVYCFIAHRDYSTKGLGQVKAGQVFKAASWNAPAKHARGDLFDRSTWDKCFGEFGVAYLK